MMQNQITVSNIVLTKKPLDTEVGKISNSIVNVVDVNPRTIKDIVLKFAWSPSTFNEGKSRSIENFKSSSIIALDIDGGIAHDEAIKILANNGVYVNVTYSTFSNRADAYRLIIFLNKPIESKSVFKKVLVEFNNLLNGGCDKSCLEVSRLFYPGLEILHFDKEINDLQYVLDLVNCSIVKNDYSKTRSIIDTDAICGEIVAKKSEKSVQQIDEYTKKVGCFDYVKAIRNVKLVEAFYNGEWLYHNELFGLATSFVHIGGGIKFMKDVMETHNESGKTQYTANNFAILPYVAKKKYPPKRLVDYSRFEEDASYKNVITAVVNCRGYVRTLSTDKKMTIEQAEYQAHKFIEDYFAHSEIGRVDLLIGAAGLGKTDMLLQQVKEKFLKDGDFNITIALKTHNLIEEFENRLNSLGIPCVKTPELPSKLSKNLKKILDLKFANGMRTDALEFMRDIANGKNKDATSHDTKIMKDYYQQTKAAYEADGVVLTTHAKGINGQFKSQFLVFDECPQESIMKISKFRISDLITMSGYLRKGVDSAQFCNAIAKLRNTLCDNLVADTTIVRTEIEEFTEIDLKVLQDFLKDSKISVNALEFLNCNSFIKSSSDENCIDYITHQPLRNDKCILILSATPKVSIYKATVGDRLVVLDAGVVEQVGTQIQYMSNTYSKSNLAKQLAKDAPDILKSVGDDAVITFKENKKFFENSTNQHFGNACGTNELKGKNISVVGTVHLPEQVYFLILSVCGVQMHKKDHRLSMRRCIWNGVEFDFMTYENEELRNMQFMLIECEMLQACGRARLLREYCTVSLYSNFPLRTTTTFVGR